MDAPDEIVEAVAEALFHHWYGAEWSEQMAALRRANERSAR